METQELFALEQSLLRERDECERIEQELRSLAVSYDAAPNAEQLSWAAAPAPPLPALPPPPPPVDDALRRHTRAPELALPHDGASRHPAARPGAGLKAAAPLQFRSPMYRSASPAKPSPAQQAPVVTSDWGRSSRFPDPARNDVPGPGAQTRRQSFAARCCCSAVYFHPPLPPPFQASTLPPAARWTRG